MFLKGKIWEVDIYIHETLKVEADKRKTLKSVNNAHKLTWFCQFILNFRCALTYSLHGLQVDLYQYS